MKVSIVIPARYASTRFPGKLLEKIDDHPVLWHTLNAARSVKNVAEVYVAVDNQLVFEAVQSWGGKAIMTNPSCRSGMERTASIISELKGDIILNLQGDEPLVDPKILESFISEMQRSQADILTPVYKLANRDHLFDPNLVKVVLNKKGQALYFSRSTIPFVRDIPQEQWFDNCIFYGHIGIYICRRAVLENYHNVPSSLLESAENLEQLRFMDYGYSIYTFLTEPTVGIDTPSDLKRAQILFQNKIMCSVA